MHEIERQNCFLLLLKNPVMGKESTGNQVFKSYTSTLNLGCPSSHCIIIRQIWLYIVYMYMASVFFRDMEVIVLQHGLNHAIEKGHSKHKAGKQNCWAVWGILNEILVQVPLHHVLMLGKYIQSWPGFPRCFLLGQSAECAVNHECIQVS